MSEYLIKKAVLEWLDDRRYKSPWIESFRDRLESGAFDAPEMEHVNAYWAREGLIKHQQEEIQRLRAALEMAQSELRWGDPTNAIERVERIIDEALSTTSEPTNAAKVKRIECPCCGCEISINAPEGDGNDV